uniref:Uncharacterized protein n=1 Tax=Caldiarchaeum subterraneum TaxID=311458 RepID=E6N3L7_CALS0|nr:hypothetical protein HGMM_F37B02C06 [Candidatus Caldarchaeum subterraneum]
MAGLIYPVVQLNVVSGPMDVEDLLKFVLKSHKLVHLPEPYLQAIDELVKRRLYPNQAEPLYTLNKLPIRREG